MSGGAMIGIIDYDAGNISSVASVLKKIGYRTRVSKDPNDLEKCAALVLPGVGAFPSAMASLRKANLVEFIRLQATDGKPILGICLGMQLLAESSTEIIETEGLGLVPGKVVALGEGAFQIGWNKLIVKDTDSALKQYEGELVYFNHSFFLQLRGETLLATSTMHDEGWEIPVAVRNKNIIGLQFHPEKSQKVGEALLGTVLRDLLSAD